MTYELEVDRTADDRTRARKMATEDQENNTASSEVSWQNRDGRLVGAPGEMALRQETPGPSLGLLQEIWRGFRPYLVKMFVDFFISSGLWILLFLFKGLQTMLSMHGWVVGLVSHIHSAGVVVVFALFALFLAIDFYKIRKKEE